MHFAVSGPNAAKGFSHAGKSRGKALEKRHKPEKGVSWAFHGSRKASENIHSDSAIFRRKRGEGATSIRKVS